MPNSLKSILIEALELSPVDRAYLIEELLSSFEFSERSEVDSLWASEAESRLNAYKNGDLKSRSVKEVLKDINR